MVAGKIIKTGAKYFAKKTGKSKAAQKKMGVGIEDPYRVSSAQRAKRTTGQQKTFDKAKRDLSMLKQQSKSVSGIDKIKIDEKIMMLENKIKDMKKRLAVRAIGGKVGSKKYECGHNRLY